MRMALVVCRVSCAVPATGARAAAGGDLGGLVRRFAQNPFQQTLALRASLELDSTQVARLQALAEAHDGQVNTLATAVSERAARIGNNADPAAMMQLMREPLADAQRIQREALTALQAALTPAQWEKLPPRITLLAASIHGATGSTAGSCEREGPG